MKHILAILTVLLLAPVTALHAATPAKPNIIFILADDLGIGNIGCYGADNYKTPHLDKLARSGTRYRFRKLVPGTICCSTGGKGGTSELQTREIIITFGRSGYHANDVEVAAGTAVSRRHCLIVNCKDDAWLYDLQSTGTYLNNRPVKPKEPFVGLTTIRIGGKEFAVSTDKEKLL